MGKKNKKEKKGAGKQKTVEKTEKKAQKRSKKELAEKGEESIEQLIAQFQEEDKKKTQVTEEKCQPPTPRCNLSLVGHPDKDELIMFGGEYFTGNKMFVYNDMYSYRIKKNDWLKISIPNAPPPRSAHQAVAISHQGGQMWLFGGEYSSHSQAQFYHYKELWLLHLKEKRWEQIKAPGGPSARSGHRMVAMKKQLIIFGGYHDNSRDYKYFSDVFIFDVETYTWNEIKPSGNGPSPRSGCIFLSMPDSGKVMVYGGYSKEKLKKDVDKGITHTDMFLLAQEKKRDAAASAGPEKWKWQSVKQTGIRPSARSGLSGTTVPGHKAFLFGGVCDEEEDEEQLDGVFYNDFWSLDMDMSKWFHITLRSQKPGTQKKKRRRKAEEEMDDDHDSEDDNDEGSDGDNKQQNIDEVDMIESNEDETMELTQDGIENLKLQKPAQSTKAETGADSVFQVTIAEPSHDSHGATAASANADKETTVEAFKPSARMNTALAVKDGLLFMYGGMFEEGDKQVTLNDFYSFNIQKMEAWNVLIAEDKRLQEWQDSDSSDDEGAKAAKNTGHDDDDEDSDDSDESMEITFDDAPPRHDSENLKDYFERSQQYWVEKARSIYMEDGETVSDRTLFRFGKELCEEACGK